MAPEPLDFSIEPGHFDGSPALLLSGELDMATSTELATRIDELLEQRPPLIAIDMAKLSFIDSSGVGTLLKAQRLASARGVEVVLVAPSERCREILGILAATDLFTIRD